jgi:Putative DNA-binding domain
LRQTAKVRAMTSLLEQQRAFRAALLGGAESLPEIVGGNIAAKVRLGVYRNNVLGNLTAALGLAFPAVARLVGPAFFAAAAERFIVSAPPRGADLYEYGDNFPGFIDAFEPAGGLPYLADVARLEWAVGRALHTPFAPSLEPAALIALSPAVQANLRFEPHPSLSLLALSHPTRAIWEAVLTPDSDQRAARLAAIDAPTIGFEAGAEHLAVLCTFGEIAVLPLTLPGFAVARALADGVTLDAALAAVPSADVASADVAGLLATFLAGGFFGRILLPAAVPPAPKGTAP